MAPSRTFAVTFDYRCPFARNAHEHVVTALGGGADWDVTFRPFSLDQMHVDDGDDPVWDRAEQFPGLLVNLAGVAVRDLEPERFLTTHLALFAARHDHGRDLRERTVVSDVLTEQGVDVDAVFDSIDGGEALAQVRKEHEAAEAQHDVWGVPTFISGDEAVFVRLMHRPDGDGELARTTIERVLDLHEWTDLNEYKRTTVPR